MKINVLISTIDDRIDNVENVILDPREEVEYIVSHQYSEERFKYIPASLLRDDVTVSHIKGMGVATSRNNAIRLATGDIAHFLDDDVSYQNSFVDCIKNTYAKNPDNDIALFKIKTAPEEPEYKNYPAEKKKLDRITYSISTLEITFNLKKIKSAGLYFDERFGAGQELIIGSEETIFIEDALEKNLNVWYFPEYVAGHPYRSTINSIPEYDKRRIWVLGAYDCRKNGAIAILKAFLGTIKFLPSLVKHKVNPFFYFYNRFSAALYILQTNKSEFKKRELWRRENQK